MEYEVRSSEGWDEARFTIEDDGDGLTMLGPMALYAKPSALLSDLDLGAASRAKLAKYGKRTFREVIEPGAFRKSLSEAPDIVLHYQHDERSLPLGRTKAGTLTLTDEARQVGARAKLPDNEWGRPVRDAVKRGDIGGISFRMGHVIDSWGEESLDDGYRGPVRHLHEIQLRREVSLVTFPAYQTHAAVRELAEAAGLEPTELEEALVLLRVPDATISSAQRDLIVSALNARTEAPVADAAGLKNLAHKRELLLALG